MHSHGIKTDGLLTKSVVHIHDSVSPQSDLIMLGLQSQHTGTSLHILTKRAQQLTIADFFLGGGGAQG